jgi:hypothetical protein
MNSLGETVVEWKDTCMSCLPISPLELRVVRQIRQVWVLLLGWHIKSRGSHIKRGFERHHSNFKLQQSRNRFDLDEEAVQLSLGHSSVSSEHEFQALVIQTVDITTSSRNPTMRPLFFQ